MSDPQYPGFAKLVPGFDFLQNLAKGAAQGLPQMPHLANWVAPTVSVDELDKRIAELKAVHFWLDQNGKALAATIQALEVQKMTLATLQGMNFNLGEMAKAFQLDPDAAAPAGAAPQPKDKGKDQHGPDEGEPAGRSSAKGGKASKAAQPAGVVDPLQWWGALTQQFQQIAADTLKDVAGNPAMDGARTMATEAMRAASGMTRAAAPRAPARRKPDAAKKARAAPRKGKAAR